MSGRHAVTARGMCADAAAAAAASDVWARRQQWPCDGGRWMRSRFIGEFFDSRAGRGSEYVTGCAGNCQIESAGDRPGPKSFHDLLPLVKPHSIAVESIK